MDWSDESEGVWFVYDGDCPICSYAAVAWRIKREYGDLHLLDARVHADHPLIQAINRRHLDLDEGMVIVHRGTFYHGKDALRFMGRFGARRGLFSRLFAFLFRSDRIAAVLYPPMRAVRNGLLRLLGRSRIDNLVDRDSPVFRPVFGVDWNRLPAVLKARYAVRPFSDDRVAVEGTMDLECLGPLRLLNPVYRLAGTAPFVTERDVPVTVEFDSDAGSRAMTFTRHFRFRNRKPYRFRSRMLPRRGNEVVELMGFGLCWRGLYSCDGRSVHIAHKGYALRMFGRLIPFPGTLLFGRCEGRETALDERRFTLDLKISHPLFGKVYSYAGRFTVR